MSVTAEQTIGTIPATYQEWLDCFEQMKTLSSGVNGVFEAAAQGSFTGTEITLVALQNQLVDTVNAVLDKSVKRFVKKLNESLMFHDLFQMDLLFRRLKQEIHRALFFENLPFLPAAFRKELSESVKTQMSTFWNNTLAYLYEQSLESSDSQLEDVLFFINRIHLF